MKNIDKDRLQMYVSIVRITIVLCWLSLFSFWIVKLFCNEVFEIAVQNDNFIRFSETLQNTWLKYLVSFITISISNYLMLGAVLQKFVFKGNSCLVVIISVLITWVSANFINVDIIKMISGYIVAIISAIIMQKKWKKLYGFVGVALDFVFSTLSMITRNIELRFLTNYVVILVLSIDVYIMFALYYLYSNLLRLKKEQ